MSPRVRTIIYAVVVLGLFLGYFPWQVLQLDVAIKEYLDMVLTYCGALLFAIGSLLLLSGAYYLVSRGEGTPLPFDPPQRMVVAGPYAHMQHPMALGFLIVAFAEAVWFRSVSLVVYALLLTVLVNLYIIYLEEPGLERRFGEDYRAYQAATPRWFPFPFGRPRT